MNREYYNTLLYLYKGISHTHHLYYYEWDDFFGVMSVNTETFLPPWSGIKVHTPLSNKIYEVLIDHNFQQMMIYREIDGIKIFKSQDPKQVTFYISFHSIRGYKKLLHIFRAHGIHVEPKLRVDRDRYGSLVWLNKMYISTSEDIFVRYSTDLRGDILKGTAKYKAKIIDSTWRSAADKGHPQIWAVSRSYLLHHLHNLNYEDDSHIFTFLTLMDYGEIVVPVPNILLSIKYYHNDNRNFIALEAYNIQNGRSYIYDLSTEEYVKKFSERIADPPERILHDFLI
jgi:hypothetical protein